MIPNFEGYMKPILEILSDGKVHTSKECIYLANEKLHLTEAERAELLPSKKQGLSTNRFHWAHFYLSKAGLVKSQGKGKYQITEDGLEFLQENPNEINIKSLMKIQSFSDFINPTESNTNNQKSVPNLDSDIDIEKKTPDEIMNDCYKKLQSQLIDEVLDMVLQQSPKFFEGLVVNLLEKMGYGAGTITSYTGDGGIDGIIDEDKLGLDVIHIQAKRYAKGNHVGRPELQSFVGALAGQNGNKGVFITTSDFSQAARDYHPSGVKVVKIDGHKLAELMIEYNLGVSTSYTYELKKIDKDFFED